MVGSRKEGTEGELAEGENGSVKRRMMRRFRTEGGWGGTGRREEGGVVSTCAKASCLSCAGC